MPTAIYGGDWNYSGDPTTSVLDEVRFWMQDVDAELPLMGDTEVTYLVGQFYETFGSAIYVAAVGAEVLAAKFTRQVAVSADGVSVQTGELSRRYNELAQSLREQYKALTSASASALVTGVMFPEHHDPSIAPLIFGTGFMDNYRVGRADYGDYDPGDSPGYHSGDDYGVVDDAVR